MDKNKKQLLYIRLFSFVFIILALISIYSVEIVLAFEKNTFTLNEVILEDKSDGVTGSITNYNDNEINNDIVFHKLNDYVTYKLIIQNNIDRDITIKSITDNSEDEFIEYEYDSNEDTVVGANNSFELIIKAIYKNEQTDINNRSYTSDVKFTIKYLDKDEESSSSITINPKTNDNIYIITIILIISIIGLIVCLICYRRLSKKDIYRSIMPIILVIVLVPAIVKAATVTIDFILSTKYSLFDKVVITYVVDGTEKTIINTYGEVITGLDEPTKDNYNFVGWTYEDGSSFDITKDVTGDIKIIAKFEKKRCTLVFNGNSDDSSVSGEMDNQTVYYGDNTTINTNMLTRNGYKFMGWNTDPDGNGTHYEDSDLINLTVEGEINLYAEWLELTSFLVTGESFNDLVYDLNSNILEFKKSNSKPNINNIEYRVISTDESNFPVYVWNEEGIVYWWSEAETVYMNSNCNKMFYGMTTITNIDFTGLDSSNVTTMDFMFQYCYGLTTMDLRLNTSKVTSMDAMFANCKNLESIDLSHIDTSKVENFHGLVAGCTNLTSINLNNFSTEGAVTFESMFSTLPNLTEIDLSSFNTPNLTSVYFMFLRCTKLTTIYASEGLDISNVTDTRGPLSNSTKIVGGAGTTYSSTTASKVPYFRIDDPDNGKPGYLTLKNARYIRYNSNGADGGSEMTSHYLTTTNPGNLKTNTYTKTGQVFVGWNTEANGSGISYTDGQLMDELEASKTPLTLYAMWE